MNEQKSLRLKDQTFQNFYRLEEKSIILSLVRFREKKQTLHVMF